MNANRTQHKSRWTGWMIPFSLVGVFFGATVVVEYDRLGGPGEQIAATEEEASLLIGHPAWSELSAVLRKDLLQVARSVSPERALEALEAVVSIAPEFRWGLRVMEGGWLMYACQLAPGEPFLPYSQRVRMEHEEEAIIMASLPISDSNNNFPGWEFLEEFYTMPDLTPETVMSEVPALHSNPAAAFTLYLDFEGSEISGRFHNDQMWKRPVVRTHRFSIDANREEFNADELQYIYDVWSGVAEYFSPFSINVTTVRPAAFGRKSLHVAVTEFRDQNGTWLYPYLASGWATLGLLGKESDELAFKLMPAFAFTTQPVIGLPVEQFPLAEPGRVARIIAHEVGHAFGLSHDGMLFRSLESETPNGYFDYANSFFIDLENFQYNSRGFLERPTWSPIMGGGSVFLQVSQWSRGEYVSAGQLNPWTNTVKRSRFDDDMAVIAHLSGRASVTLEGEYDENGVMEMGVIGEESARVEGLLAWQQKDSFRVIPQTNSLTIMANPQRMVFMRDYRANKRTISHDRRMLDFVVKVEDEATGTHLVIDDFPRWKRTVPVEPGRPYIVHITPTGRGNPMEWTLIPRVQFDIFGNPSPDPYYAAVGYTAYGSRGRYELEISSPALPPEDAPLLASNWTEGAPVFAPVPWTEGGQNWEPGDGPAPGAYLGTFKNGGVRVNIARARERKQAVRVFNSSVTEVITVTEIPFTARLWVAGFPVAFRGMLQANKNGNGFIAVLPWRYHGRLKTDMQVTLEVFNDEMKLHVVMFVLDSEMQPVNKGMEITTNLRPLRFGRGNPYVGPNQVPVALSDGNGWQQEGRVRVLRNGRVVLPTSLPDGRRSVMGGFVEAGGLPDRGRISIFQSLPPRRDLDPGANPLRPPRGFLGGRFQIDFKEALPPDIEADLTWSRIPFQADTLMPGEAIPLTVRSLDGE